MGLRDKPTSRPFRAQTETLATPAPMLADEQKRGRLALPDPVEGRSVAAADAERRLGANIASGPSSFLYARGGGGPAPRRRPRRRYRRFDR
jgi:hypothetical protein